MLTNTKMTTTILIALMSAIGCSSSERSFSILAETEIFDQEDVKLSQPKIDILWVIDGSGTMENHQTNLANNFGAFINDFIAKDFDYHMAITSTDAWLREVNYNGGGCTSSPNPSLSPNTLYRSSADCDMTLATYGSLTHFRDGDIYGERNGTPGIRSGQFMISNLMTPTDVLNTFAVNAKVGVRGDGSRESGLASIRAVLRRNQDGSIGYSSETHTQLSNFRRQDAFLAVIIVTDEDDQSRKQNNTAYANTNEYVTSFKTFLDNYTGSVDGNRKYNVSSIVINDINNCAYGLHAQATQAYRYVAISEATEGIVGNICSTDFSTELLNISKQIVQLSTRFQLNREPLENTIRVVVDNQTVPQDSQNGWTYISENGFYFIEFHGTAVPKSGAQIAVNFDPVSLQ